MSVHFEQMSEKYEESGYRESRAYLDDFFEGLYLTGEPMRVNEYPVDEIAKAGRRYLQSIGVQELSPEYFVSEIEPHIKNLMSPDYAPDGHVKETDAAPLALGMVVGTAVYHPDSRLRSEQKDLLITQAVGALKRMNMTEEDNHRGDPRLFVELFTGCAQQYHPEIDSLDVRRRLFERYSTPQFRERRSSGFRTIMRRAGVSALRAARYYPGAPTIPHNFNTDEKRPK